MTYLRKFCYLKSSCVRKSITLMLWVSRRINSRFCCKTRWQMSLMVSVRRVGAHSGENQHGVSLQISISLGKTFLRISRIRNIPLIWILARVFVYVPPFIAQILNFIYWTVLIFILICGVTLKTSNNGNGRFRTNRRIIRLRRVIRLIIRVR